MTDPGSAETEKKSAEDADRVAVPQENPSAKPIEPTVVMQSRSPNDPALEPTVVRPLHPRKPLPAEQAGTALEPRWKISTLTAALSLLAALVAGIAVAAFLVSKADRSARTAETVPQSIPQAAAPGTEVMAPEASATPASTPDVPTVIENDTPLDDRYQGGAGVRNADKETRADEDRDEREREQDKRDRERDKREDEREREDAKREAEREREQAKNEAEREREERKRGKDRDDGYRGNRGNRGNGGDRKNKEDKDRTRWRERELEKQVRERERQLREGSDR